MSLIKKKYALAIAVPVAVVCSLVIVIGLAYLMESISYVPEKINGVENSTPYIPPKVANSIIQYFPYLIGILFGFNGLTFVHLMSSSNSRREEAFKELHKLEMEQAKCVAEAKAFSSKSSYKSKKPTTDYAFIIQMYGIRMGEYERLYKSISRVIKVDVLIEIITLFLLVISFLTTFLAIGKINETFGLDAITFIGPFIFVLFAIVANSAMIVGLAISPVEIEKVYYEILE